MIGGFIIAVKINMSLVTITIARYLIRIFVSYSDLLMLQKITILALLLFIMLSNCYGQYSISGYIETEQKNKTVYLSLLKYDEETLITESQILFFTKTDSTGHFEFKGQLLSNKDKIYRIHSNVDDVKGFQLVSNNKKNNYHNFIFSNTGTIYFSKSQNNWFSISKNTNNADKEWRKLEQFEKKLIAGNYEIKNKEAQQQAVTDFTEKIKAYSNINISHPLVKLLAFSDIKRNNFDVKSDFEKNPDFYNDILKSLESYYSHTSYFLQFQDEISRISNSIVQQKYSFHKNLNYVLGILVVIFGITTILLLKKLRVVKHEEVKNQNLTLTNQEEKIAKLILKDKSNQQIADELFVSLSTVKTHIRNLYAKLNVSNRHELSEKFKNQPKD